MALIYPYHFDRMDPIMKHTLTYLASAFALTVAQAMALPAAHAAPWPDTGVADAGASRWSDVFGPPSELVLGLGVRYGPRYQGAAADSMQPLPVLSYQRGMLFADTARGVGLQFQPRQNLYVSQSLWYDPGRLDRNSDSRPGSARLAGMGDVPGSVTARTLVIAQLTPSLSASAEAELALRDSARRNRYRLGLEQNVFKAAADTLVINADTWWGDARYNQAYFGVTAQQAARAGFAVFRPGSGMHAWSLGATWEHTFDAHWGSSLQLTATRYPGKVSDGPIARQAGIATNVAITYTY